MYITNLLHNDQGKIIILIITANFNEKQKCSLLNLSLFLESLR